MFVYCMFKFNSNNKFTNHNYNLHCQFNNNRLLSTLVLKKISVKCCFLYILVRISSVIDDMVTMQKYVNRILLFLIYGLGFDKSKRIRAKISRKISDHFFLSEVEC